jgi:NADH-quinone oxidoreductase subunit D
MPGFIDEYHQLLTQNEILLARTKNVGVLSKELAINIGASGPVLRASGVKWDLRRADPYSIYDRFEFDIPTSENGDSYDRYWIKMQEMKQSVRILEQAIKEVPEGPIKTNLPQLIHPPVGEVYSRIEAPKGELGYYIVSDNSIAPYRLHIRPAELINLTALRDMVIGWKIADLIIIFGSMDICMGEIDR